MMSCKQLGSVRSAFPSYTNVISNVQALDCDERVMAAATESLEAKAARRLRPERKSNFLLQTLVSRFSSQMDLVVNLIAQAFLTAVACLTVSRHRVFAG